MKITWAICNLQYEIFLLSSLAWSRDNDRPAANETPWRQHTECVTMMLPLDCIRVRRWTPIKKNKAELMVSFDLNNNVSPITNWFGGLWEVDFNVIFFYQSKGYSIQAILRTIVANINFMVVGLTLPEIYPTIYYIGGKHATHYTQLRIQTELKLELRVTSLSDTPPLAILWCSNFGILDSNGIPSCTSAGCVLQLCKVS